MKAKEDEIILLMQKKESQEKGMKLMMDTYQCRLYWHIERLIMNADLAKDILQETFIKAYQNFFQFKKESRLYTWLYRIATNEALQYLKKNNKLQKADSEATLYIENQIADDNLKNTDKIEELLEKAIQRLPEKQKVVFNLRYYDNLPYEEIAKILDTSVSTLKTNYHYAKEKIEHYILEHYQDF